MLFLKISIILVLAFISFQDFKDRAVYWFLFPILIALFISEKIALLNYRIVFTDAFILTGFLLVQLFFLWLYFTIKAKRAVNITNGLLGWGDILFLFVTCFYFSPVSYIAFYILALIISICFAFLCRFIYKNVEVTIPLAGIQSLLLIVILLTGGLLKLNFQFDEWIKYLI